MPQYEYKCKTCNNTNCVIRSVANRDDILLCSVCNNIMNRVVSSSFIKVNGFNAANGYSSATQSVKGE